MKDAQLNTLCQRHQAVLINSASNSITVAVVDAPSHALLDALHFATQNRLILCAGLASKWKIIGISRIRHPRQTPRKAEKPQPSFSIRHYARRWRNAPLISISNPGASRYRIRLRIDGVLHILQDIAKETGLALTARLKVPEIWTSLNIGCRRTGNLPLTRRETASLSYRHASL